MARSSFLAEFDKQVTVAPPGGGTPVTSTKKYRTTYSCVPRVAKFLGIENETYTPDPEDKVDRASYTREYTKSDGTKGTLTITAGKIPYLAYGKANARKISLKTGAQTTNKTFKIVSLTFPSFLNIAQIADMLGEMLPTNKVAAVGVVPTDIQVEPFFSVKGGRKYPIPTSAKAEATPSPNLAKTEAEQTTILAETTSKNN
jgi:hypothetical protein